MKSAHDLVILAKSQITEIDIGLAEEEIKAVDVLVDVREPDEYMMGHIQGAVHIPRGLLEFKMSASESLSSRDLQILVYCKNGGRSSLAAKTLVEMGYLNVRAIAGGFDAWVVAGKPIAKIAHPELG